MMSDNDIRKEFQSKFSGFEAPIPAKGWESVERSLKVAAAARTALRRRWYAGSVAAVLLLLIGSILFIRNPMEQTETTVSESVSGPPFSGSMPDSGAEREREPETAPEAVVQPVKIRRLTAARAGREADIRPATPARMMEAWMEREKLQTKVAERRMEAGALHLPARAVEKGQTQSENALHPEETIMVGGDDRPFFAGGKAAEKDERPLLLAFAGRGGMTDYQQTVNSPMTLRSATVSSDSKNPLQLKANNTAENISEMEHDQPVSFGITVSKYLFDDVSIETGIIYSYLHSKIRNSNNNFRVQEEQKFHYLGIPLNVNYNLFSLRQLNVYVSVGGMVEKDIYGEFWEMREGQAVNFNNASEDSEEKKFRKISQQNPQISVNAGVGLSYPIYDRLRLYGKIGGAYYFDAKNENRTIYSDGKIVMDLNLGLKYEF